MLLKSWQSWDDVDEFSQAVFRILPKLLRGSIPNERCFRTFHHWSFNMRIAVVGSGYVGLVAGACFADLGHDVILVDNDQSKLTALKNGQVPIHEKFLPELLTRHRGKRLTFSDDLKEAVRLSAAIFVAVGTPPTESGEADLSYVESVAREISGGVVGYKVVVEKSTVPVYTSEWVRKIILRSGTDPELFDVASNPEFLREGTAVTDFLFPDRIVIGCDSDRSAAVLREVYAPLTKGSYYQSSGAIPQPDRAPIPAAAHRDQQQERGVDQACLQRFPRHEDFFHQCRSLGLRIRGCQRESGGARHWHAIPASGPGS